MQALGADAFATHQKLIDQLAGQGVRQTPAATAIGRQRNVAVGHDKYGVAGGHDEITGQRQRETGPRGRTFDCSNHRLGTRADCLNPGMKPVNTLFLHIGGEQPVGLQALEISARTEDDAFTHNNDAANVLVVSGMGQSANTFRIDLRPQRISVRGVGNGQDQDATLPGLLKCGGHDPMRPEQTVRSLLRASGSSRWRHACAARGWGGSVGPRKPFAY